MGDSNLDKLVKLQKQLNKEFENQKKWIESKKIELDKREEDWKNNCNKLEKIQLKERVKLDIGGQIFSTSVQTLKSDPNSFFGAMFSGRWEAKMQEDGCLFIDRDPFVFRYVLNFLRGEKIQLDKLGEEELERLQEDAEFYQLDKKKLFGDDLRSWVWNPNTNFEISGNGKIAKKILNSTNWNVVTTSTILPKGGKFSVKLLNSANSHVMIGVAPKGINVLQTYNHSRKGGGWYMYCSNGSIYSDITNQVGIEFGKLVSMNSIVTVELTLNGALKYYVDGKLIGEAYQGINQEVVPAVEMCIVNDSVQFV